MKKFINDLREWFINLPLDTKKEVLNFFNSIKVENGKIELIPLIDGDEFPFPISGGGGGGGNKSIVDDENFCPHCKRPY